MEPFTLDLSTLGFGGGGTGIAFLLYKIFAVMRDVDRRLMRVEIKLCLEGKPNEKAA